MGLVISAWNSEREMGLLQRYWETGARNCRNVTAETAVESRAECMPALQGPRSYDKSTAPEE
jgi:hypothetical protein